MAQFKKLYEYCQTLDPKISTKDLERKVLEITGTKVLQTARMTLDVTRIRGFFISADNVGADVARLFSRDVIILAKGMNKCWQRFVFTKELMHFFDSPEEKVAHASHLESLLSDFEVPKPTSERSEQFESEANGLWMALACLCPEKHRLEFKEQLKDKHTDYYEIALKLKIPEHQVPNLFRENFLDIIEKIIERK